MGSRLLHFATRGLLLAGVVASLMILVGSDSEARWKAPWAQSLARGRKGHVTPTATPGVTATTCTGGTLPVSLYKADLVVSGKCEVKGGTYYYGNINIIKDGTLKFDDALTDFWAKSIIVEKGGSLIAGTEKAPIGTNGKGPGGTTNAVVTINLWGAQQYATPTASAMPQAVGVLCQSPNEDKAPCGIPPNIWNSNGQKKIALGNGVTDYFYDYQPLMFDDGKGAGGQVGYFGYKTIGVSYGGTIQLFGKKGSTFDGAGVPQNALLTGTSWVRLDQNSPLKPGDTQFTVAGDVTGSWEAGDDIVVTTTDYLPGHSEKLKIASVSYNAGTKHSTIGWTQRTAPRFSGRITAANTI